MLQRSRAEHDGVQNMPPRNKKAASGADRMKDVNETEEALQAVVLADSFETRFSPFTLERPRVWAFLSCVARAESLHWNKRILTSRCCSVYYPLQECH